MTWVVTCVTKGKTRVISATMSFPAASRAASNASTTSPPVKLDKISLSAAVKRKSGDKNKYKLTADNKD